MDASDKLKTVFENLREVVTAPITAISETIQTAVSNLQSDKQDVSSTSETEHPLASSVTQDSSSSNIVTASDEKVHSSLAETIQDQTSSMETSTKDEHIIEADQSHAPAVTVHEETVAIEPVSTDISVS